MKAFGEFDRDRSGNIDVGELRNALEHLGLRTRDDIAASLIARYDIDGSGTIELHEFAILARDISLFTQFDKDRNGIIDAAELRHALFALAGVRDARQAALIMKAWDVDGSETLDLVEFSALLKDLKVFLAFDRDGSGTISASELKKALRQLGVNVDSAAAGKILAKYDDSGDGGIDLREFSQLVADLPSIIEERLRGRRMSVQQRSRPPSRPRGTPVME